MYGNSVRAKLATKLTEGALSQYSPESTAKYSTVGKDEIKSVKSTVRSIKISVGKPVSVKD